MRCPVCEKAGEESAVHPGPGSRTSLLCRPFYGEDGCYHHHDMNTTRQMFSCSRGHKWVVASRPACPSAKVCGHKGRREVEVREEGR